jgi:hypothetical protein
LNALLFYSICYAGVSTTGSGTGSGAGVSTTGSGTGSGAGVSTTGSDIFFWITSKRLSKLFTDEGTLINLNDKSG